MTLDELGARMSGAEFSMWLRLYELDPWDEHMDFGFGQVAANVANYAGKQRPDGVPQAVASDYMPLPHPREALVDPDPMKFFGSL